VVKLQDYTGRLYFSHLKSEFSETLGLYGLVALNEMFPCCWMRFLVPLALT
jgi:hypothetical protein